MKVEHIGQAGAGKIERLANLEPSIEALADHASDLFKTLRGFVVLDWVLKHPNDLGQMKAEAKFAGLIESAAKLMDKIQEETEKD